MVEPIIISPVMIDDRLGSVDKSMVFLDRKVT